MSLLVVIMCFLSKPCDETTAPWVARKEMTSEQCRGYAAALVAEINANKLNPDNGYYMLECRKVEPKA